MNRSFSIHSCRGFGKIKKKKKKKKKKERKEDYGWSLGSGRFILFKPGRY